MSDPYERVKGGRLSFKDGCLATRKSIDKKKKKKKHKKHDEFQPSAAVIVDGSGDPYNEAGQTYTIDAAKNMKYGELFPVEAKKFGYDPKTNVKTNVKTVEDALDDRVKKKADRYCK